MDIVFYALSFFQISWEFSDQYLMFLEINVLAVEVFLIFTIILAYDVLFHNEISYN